MKGGGGDDVPETLDDLLTNIPGGLVVKSLKPEMSFGSTSFGSTADVDEQLECHINQELLLRLVLEQDLNMHSE
ncbi:hypothetical protein RDI58_015000 [Solanum bulbocastanum]|uniref:Uncharacterized protein n=1 Tax=Solanum bulbocastanum TaxID=147425 RepID=A0AAN8YB33_SOLBU